VYEALDLCICSNTIHTLQPALRHSRAAGTGQQGGEHYSSDRHSAHGPVLGYDNACSEREHAATPFTPCSQAAKQQAQDTAEQQA
jgi:hypothetical protein